MSVIHGVESACIVDELAKRTKSLELAVVYNGNHHMNHSIDVLDLAGLFLVYMEKGDFVKAAASLKEDIKNKHKERCENRNQMYAMQPGILHPMEEYDIRI